MAEVEMAMREMEIQANLQHNSENQDQGENYKEHGKSTEKQKNSTEKDLEKNKKSAIGQEMNTDAVIAESRKLRLANNKRKLKDAMDEIMKDQSTNKICKSLEIYPKTWNKVYRNLEVMVNEAG
jgi:hypothetical protein